MALGAVAAVGIAEPWLLLALPLVCGLAWWLRQFPRARCGSSSGSTASASRRSTRASRRPRLARERCGPTASVRAARRLWRALHVNAGTWWWWLVCNRAFGLALDLLSSALVVTLVAVSAGAKSEETASTTAFALVYALSLSGLFQYMLRQSALAESFLTSVERLSYFEPGSRVAHM